ncbi:MAG: MucB/RseB C-terminal domain-containing protein [Colwellia sp.]|nr:MucB/RseB C-terminal domain-containing protein [Colwellia sp.]MCW8864393.1 MucB/RseB C-terminal domain-containing protein [Colwellia sp.]MCW9080806.1 MucB/RseB C-terminal domain-containing protein [Colwellia sp.]
MKILSPKLLTKLFSLHFLISACFSFSAIAADAEQARLSLERLSKSLRELNFNTSFVVVKNNQAEPYHWLHGVVDAPENKNVNDGESSKGERETVIKKVELEILALLNGPRRDILRIGNTVSYIEPEYAPYSIDSSQISGPIPAVFGRDISILDSNYHFVSVGKSRVLGRAAQLIRIVPQDEHRYGYWLWLDQDSGLMLKLAVITRKGKLLEQIQFTHLEISETLSDNLKNLYVTELPKVIELSAKNTSTDFAWQVNWLPSGFKEIKSDRHRINGSKQAVEFMLFNDGLIDISVYVNPSAEKKRAIEYANDGATLVLNQVVNNVEVSVVGKIPLASAKKIVNSVSFTHKPTTP